MSLESKLLGTDAPVTENSESSEAIRSRATRWLGERFVKTTIDRMAGRPQDEIDQHLLKLIDDMTESNREWGDEIDSADHI